MLNPNRQFLTLLLLLGTLLPMAGCTGGAQGTSKRAQVYKTSGKATYLGAPLVGAVITFAPQDKQPAAVGRTNDAGEFTMTTYGGGDGAAAGEFKVMVVLNVAAADPAPQAAHSTDPGFVPPASAHSEESGKKASDSLVPAQYSDASQTPLKAKVEPNGSNKFTFELK